MQHTWAVLSGSLLLAGGVTAQPLLYPVCTPDHNLLASNCMGTFASTVMLVRNDLSGFFLGRRPTYIETDLLAGVGGRQLRESGSPDWNRVSQIWATNGVGLSTNLSYPAPQGGDSLLAQAAAGALLERGSLGVSTKNFGLAHSPSNGYSLVSTAYGSLADLIAVSAPANAPSITIRVGMRVVGSIDEAGATLGAFPYASARLGVSTVLGGSPSGGDIDHISFTSEGSVAETLSVSATFLRPSDTPLGNPFMGYFRVAGDLQTEVVNTQQAYDIDFGRTAYFSIDLPADVMWTTYSGVFLSQPVPEVSTAWMLAGGLLAIMAATELLAIRQGIRRSGVSRLCARKHVYHLGDACTRPQ